MADLSNQQKVHEAQIALLLKQFRVTGLSNVFILSIAAAVIWSMTQSLFVLPWLIVGYGLVALRPLVLGLQNKAQNKQLTGSQLEHTVTLLLVMSALHWGVIVWEYYDVNNIELFLFISAIYLGLVSGSMPSLSVRFPVWMIYAISMFLTLVIKMLYLSSWSMAMMLSIYCTAFIYFGRNLSKKIEHSITLDLKNTELLKEVNLAKEHAEKANLAKSKFMASASHDLRQPLHVQSMLLEVLSLRLEDKNLDQDELKNLVDKITQSNSALNKLFNALLEISQLDAGTLKVNLSHQNLNGLSANLFEEYRILAQQKGLLFKVEVEDCTVISDPILLQRILSNLLSNALKFTEKGCISISIKNRLDDVEIIIADTGIGIDATQFERIFEEYEQVGNQARDRNKGIGLGLALVSRLCELLNHKVDVTSKLLKGSEFKVTLARGDEPKVISVDTDINYNQIDNTQILLIDDEQDIVNAMSLILTNWGARVQGVSSIEEALCLIESSQYEPDLIISDYRLKSKETGLEGLSLINNRIGKTIPSLLISGDTDPELLEKINKQNLYILHKPVKAQLLKKVINILLKQ